MTMHDLTFNNSIFPITDQSLFTEEQTIAKKPGVNYRNAEKFLQKQKGIVFESDSEDDDSNNSDDSNNNDDYDVSIHRPMLFFQNIVETMGIDNAKIEEYQRWFDIDEAHFLIEFANNLTYLIKKIMNKLKMNLFAYIIKD
ncbi:hypothetical protein RFI_36252 [Reticulomyxa filosa]|uniref:Uncharacterized protein n=1 Tax=Reticulomyxa filosa TaxID=46433 RepID=X6LHU2_RETFI|nr:hypothetical protein RFI_36252 [Reticulomyxa filosa]|eukprot:ETO01189.1 hypothetical protein RFI_36252 [Reticulomyxa filosa]